MSNLGLQFEYDSGCLIVRATGRALIEQKEASVKAVAQTVSAQSAKALLADLRNVPPPYTFMDRFQIGELIAQYLSNVPIAALLLEEQIDPQHIGQLVAINRGATVELFVAEAAAYKWAKNFTAPDLQAPK